MQSGRGKTGRWLLEYETISRRHPEALMGWTSSEDTLNQVVLRFDTQEEAVAFAERKGWNYTVFPEHDRRIPPRNYSDNFRYIPPPTE